MSAADTGGQAFPIGGITTPNGEVVWPEYGMTLRDYFATHASDEDIKAQVEVIRAEMVRASGLGILPDNWHCRARYMHADAMLRARAA